MELKNETLKNVLIGALSFALLLTLAAHGVRSIPDGRAVAEREESSEAEEDSSRAEAEALAAEEALAAAALAEAVDQEALPPVEEEPVAEPEEEADPRAVELAAIFERAELSPGLEGAAKGFSLLDAAGETVFEHLGGTALIPASTLKTLTTATALEGLGPDFRFETKLGLSQSSESGAFEGDLIVLGGGDPTLALEDLETWASSLAEAGVVSVAGRIVGDGRFFPGSAFPDFWDWGDIGNGYGSPVSGLNLERNRFVATLVPGSAEDAPASLEDVFPYVPGVSWWNEATTGPAGSGDGITIYGGERATVMHVRGTVPLENELTVRGAVPDPEKFAAYHLREALVAAGIEVKGPAVSAGELFLAGEEIPEIVEDLLIHESPSLLSIVESIHATSDNHETECVFRLLGIESGLAPDEAVRAHWSERGLELTGLRMVDGSGLARADHITPRTLARLQHFASTGPHGELYENTLLSGMDGKLRFKAGVMSSVRAYTGLLDSASGDRYAFTLIVNHHPDSAAVQDLLQDLLGTIAAW